MMMSESASKSFLILLPNELVIEIMSYLLGDLHQFKKIDITSFRPSTREATPEEKRREGKETIKLMKEFKNQLKEIVPPFENIKALVSISMVDKASFELMRGINTQQQDVNYLEELLLDAFCFFQKLSFWLSTASIEDVNLVQGHLTYDQAFEMAEIEEIVKSYERGLNEPAIVPPYSRRLFPDWEYGCFDIKPLEPGFEYTFWGKIVRRKKLKRVRHLPKLSAGNIQRILKERMSRLDISLKEYIEVHKPIHSAFEMLLTHTLNMSLKTFSKSGYYYDVQLRQQLQKFSKDEMVFEYNETKSTPKKVGFEITKPEGWLMFLKDTEIPLQDTGAQFEDINQDSVRERLSKALILKLKDISKFDFLQNLTFPSGIRILSMEFTKETPEEDQMFAGCTFPGVHVLEISTSEIDKIYCSESSLRFQRRIINSLLSKQTFPNLEYLLLNGFRHAELFNNHKDFISNLFGLNILFDNYTERFYKVLQETSSISRSSPRLKFLSVDVQLDIRDDYVTPNAIQLFYEIHECFFTIGSNAVKRFYHDCNY